MFDSKWLLFISGTLFWLAGCNIDVSTKHIAAEDAVVAEGIIYSLKYDLGDGKTGGFTRLNIAEAVPGGNGSWNVDARGKLTSRFLIVTYPPEKHLGPQVIPVERLYDVQFGDGGIAQVSANPKSPGQ